MIKTLITTIAILLGVQLSHSQNRAVSTETLWKNELFKEFKPSDEIVSLRTLSTKSFKSGSKVIAISAAGPINYMENNKWKTIFHTIVPSSNGFQNLTNSFKSYYPAHSQGSIQTHLSNGGVIKDLLQAKMYYLDQNGNRIQEKNIEQKNGKVDVNELTYSQVYGQHIDLRLSQLTTKRKLDYIINSKNAFTGISSQAKKMVFQESVELPDSWTAELIDNVIVLKDQNGVVQAYYEKPLIHETVLHDHKDGGHDHAHHQHEIEGKYTLTKIGNSSYQIETIVDLAWLKDADRVFPLYIDPTVNCTPQNVNQWTGHLSLNGNNLQDYGTATIGARNNDVMRLGRLDENPDKFLNSWAKFDITAVPDNSTICRVQLTYTVYNSYSGQSGCGTNARMRHMANDPVAATNPALLTDIRDGDIYETRDFGGPTNGPDGTHVSTGFANLQHVQNSLVPNWVAVGFEYYQSGQHDECHVHIRGYSHANKPFLLIEYELSATTYTNVGYTASTTATMPASPACTDWSGTWCAGSGTYSQVNGIVQGANYTVENLGTAACGTAMPTANMQAWAPGGTLCAHTPIGTPAVNNFSFNATVNGDYYINVSTGFCGTPNTCGQFTGHDFTGQSAVLRYRQNTTVTNTTSNANLCFGESKNLTAVVGGTHNNPTVVWTISQGATLGTITGNTFTAGNTAGTVTIEAVVGFCRQSVTFNVAAGPQIITPTASVCSGEAASIPIDISPAASTYTWTQVATNVTGAANGSGTSINQTLSVVSPNSPGTVVYSISATVGTCSSVSTLTVTVNPPPAINAGLDQAICIGSSATLSGAGGVSYTWDHNVSDGVAFSPTSTQVYTVTGTDANGCTNTDQVTVTVNQLPAINAGADKVVCAGNTTILAGSGGVSYTWDNNVINGVPFTPTVDMTYTVTGTDANGCTNTDDILVTIAPNLTVSFTADKILGCAPESVQFTSTPHPGATYSWNFGDGGTSSTGPVTSHQYAAVGCFDVVLTVTSVDGCVGVSSPSQSSQICIEVAPVAEFRATPNDLDFSNSTATFINTSSNSTSYTWNFGDGSPLATGFSPSHTYPDSEAAAYEVILVAANQIGCTDTARVIISVKEQQLIYIPNAFTPDNDEHNPVFKPVMTAGFDPNDYTLLVFNRWGELIFESHDAEVGWDGTYANNTGICPDGTYTWKIEFKTLSTDARKLLKGHVTLIR